MIKYGKEITENDIIKYRKNSRSRVFTNRFPKDAKGGDLMISRGQLFRLGIYNGERGHRYIEPPFKGMTPVYKFPHIHWYPENAKGTCCNCCGRVIK